MNVAELPPLFAPYPNGSTDSMSWLITFGGAGNQKPKRFTKRLMQRCGSAQAIIR